MDRRQFLTGCAGASASFASKQAQSRENELIDAQYVIVELMGYKKLAGRMSKGPIPGLLQLDIPVEGGFSTQFINPASVYRMTVCDEQAVRSVMKDRDALPTLELEIQPVQRRMDYYGDNEEF